MFRFSAKVFFCYQVCNKYLSLVTHRMSQFKCMFREEFVNIDVMMNIDSLKAVPGLH